MTDEQIENLRALGRSAVMALAMELVERADELVELAVERSAGIGAAEYGDASYRKGLPELDVDVDQELADAIYYRHITIGGLYI